MTEDAARAGDGSESLAESWRAPALDVRGPAARGRRAFAGDAAPLDGGELWVAAGALYFSGRLGAWSVPLGWLGLPETGLDGVTTLDLHSADRAHPVSLRLARGAEDERALTAAIRRARTRRPEARELRGLDDLLLLLGPELRRLDSELAALERTPNDEDARAGYAARAIAAAERLRRTWLPYWGDPATRLRDATAGALLAVAETSAPTADAGAAARYEQAVRRWRNAVDDLRAWCGAPSEADTPPAPRRLGSAPAPAAQPAELRTPVAAPVEPPPLPAMPRAAVQPPAPPPLPSIPATVPALQPEPPGPTGAKTLPPFDAPQRSPAEEAAMPPQPRPSLTPEPPAEPERGIPTEPAGLGQAATPSSSSMGDRDKGDDEGDGDTQVLPGRGRAQAAASEPPPVPAAEPASQAEIAPPGGLEPAGGPVDGIEGSGGMTRLLRQDGPDGPVARKVLTPAAAAVPEVVETFLRLGQQFAGVQHQNLVRISETGRDREGGTPFIQMEWVAGATLGARTQGGVMQDLALRVLGQLAEAIDTLHAAGLTHGDVRPQNVMLEPGGRVVLLEPSVACDHRLEEQRGTVFGEPPFLTPERVSGEEPVARSDIYALATLAFLLLAGRPPFDGQPVEVFNALLDQPAPLLSDVMPGVPPAVDEALAQALAKRPEDRPASAVALVATLRRAFLMAAAQREQPVPPGAPTPAELPTQKVTPVEPAQPQPPQRAAAPSPLGRAAPNPLGRPAPPPPNNDDDGPDDGIDKTVIVRPRE